MADSDVMDRASRLDEPVAPFAAPEIFDAHLLRMNAAAPWLHRLKSEAWERFRSSPVPNRKEESWRFASIQNLELGAFRLPGNVGSDDRSEKSVPLLSVSAGSLRFRDDELIGSSGLSDSLRKRGVIFCSIEDALLEHPDFIREHLLSRLPDIGSKRFEALHAAYFKNGTFLYVPADVSIDAPLIAIHETGAQDGSAIFPHTLVVTGANAAVTLLDIFRSCREDTRHFVCGVGDIYAGEGSRVHYHAVQDWNRQTLAFHLNSASGERDAFLKSITVNVGSSHTRNEQHCRILGSGANVDLDSLSIASESQEIDQRTLQTHSAPDGHSDLLFKNVLKDNARTIFSGLIRVEENAQRTDAYQTNRNLLLSESAEANSLPGLEICANDVKCSHGATTGKVDDSNMFYFLARGIPRPIAEELLVFGFFEEIIGKIENESISELVRELVRTRFRKE